jgi:hypothetical protein
MGAAAAGASSRHVASVGAGGHKQAACGRAVGGASSTACSVSRPVNVAWALGHTTLAEDGVVSVASASAGRRLAVVAMAHGQRLGGGAGAAAADAMGVSVAACRQRVAAVGTVAQACGGVWRTLAIAAGACG